MEPITHALTSLALARAAQGRMPRYGTAMFLVSGTAADLDYLSYLGDPASFLKLHLALLHSALGSVVVVAATAGAFYLFHQRFRRGTNAASDASDAFTWRGAVTVCSIGVVAHLLLDFCAGDSVQLVWPFRIESWAWNLATNLDPWMLFLLAAGLLLPLLFRLVSEEIGERRKRFVGRAGAVATLVLLILYLGARGMLHTRATDIFGSRTYHGRTALAAAAFPSATSPFTWRGEVTTDNTIEEAELSLAPGNEFDPDRSLTRFKPDDSPALDTAQRSVLAKQFLRYTQVPLASLYRREEIYRFEIHDARFPASDTSKDDIFVRVDLNSDLSLREEGFFSAASPNN